ncbi:MAG: arylsulfatase [Rickettsiales bacterium]|nr:arylsulfatase [Rickettsiales bacterium]
MFSPVSFLLLGIVILMSLTALSGEKEKAKPNFIVIFVDDMGYGDLGVFGHPTIMTPNLDQMAYEGQKWTNFYVAASVCTPSRAGLLTGRLPVRYGMVSDNRRVLFPNSKGGLPQSEMTIAKALKGAGYATACVGKWHLGHLPEFTPNAHGFDEYFGIPYSNDMDRLGGRDVHEANMNPTVDYFNVPLMHNEEIIERPADQRTITRRYTEEAIKFIKNNQKNPFFLYLAHSMPHVPLFRSAEFEGHSKRGIYGDVIEELDWSVGQILKELKESGLDENTMVVFTSDNGPWLNYDQHGGSAGLLSGGKGGTYEGGMREPTIFWWPQTIQPGVVSELGNTMDLMPTFCQLAGVDLPGDRVYDGFDMTGALKGTGENKRDVIIYYRGTEVFAIRKGAFKAHFVTQGEYSDGKTYYKTPLLFNLNEDPSEKFNIAKAHPEVIKELTELRDAHLAGVTLVENQLEKR